MQDFFDAQKIMQTLAQHADAPRKRPRFADDDRDSERYEPGPGRQRRYERGKASGNENTADTIANIENPGNSADVDHVMRKTRRAVFQDRFLHFLDRQVFNSAIRWTMYVICPA